MKSLTIISAAVLLAGCDLPMGQFEIDPTGSATSFAVPNAIAGTCGASNLQHLVDQSEGALSAVTLPANTRIIRPGTAFTTDAVRSRLNIAIAADGTIVSLACG